MNEGQAMAAASANDGDAVLELTAPVQEPVHYAPPRVTYEDLPMPPERRWVVPAIVGAAIVVWTVVFAVTFGPLLIASPREWVELAGAWGVPVLLILVGWLLVRGSSSREAVRFQHAAELLGSEASRLEERILSVNRELGLARQFVEAQSRDLESLGRVAVERIGQAGSQLNELVQLNGEKIEAIAGVSRVALENMESLRSQLPVLASSTKDVTNFIGSAGRSAQEHVGALQTALKHLGDAGLANEQQV